MKMRDISFLSYFVHLLPFRRHRNDSSAVKNTGTFRSSAPLLPPDAFSHRAARQNSAFPPSRNPKRIYLDFKHPSQLPLSFSRSSFSSNLNYVTSRLVERDGGRKEKEQEEEKTDVEEEKGKGFDKVNTGPRKVTDVFYLARLARFVDLIVVRKYLGPLSMNSERPT